VEETGVVKELRGTMAMVFVKRQSACDSCAAGASCNVTAHGVEIEAFNPVSAAVGDTVKIHFKAFTYLKGTLYIYGIPAIALIAGAVLGKQILAGYWPALDADLAAAIAGFGLMAVSVIAVKLAIRKLEGKRELVPVIEEIISGIKK
jgi:sigma-E factor negative regulatory protein RseC